MESESDEFVLRVLFRYLVKTYTVRIPQLLEKLRGNYDLIHTTIRETTLGHGSPLYQMWLDIKSAVYVPPTKVIGNLEY